MEHHAPPSPVEELEAVIRREKRLVLLVNTASRRGEGVCDEASRLFDDHGFTVQACHAVDDEASLEAAVDEVLADPPPLLVVGSGDGTASSVAGRLAYHDVVLGHLPLGTTNNFARSLDLPLDLQSAVAVIAEGAVAPIDLGKLNDDYFANVASIGLNVEVAAAVPDILKKLAGRAAYVLGGAQAVAVHEAFHVTITSGEMRYEVDTHQLVIANGGFHSARPVAEDARIDDHLLTVFALGDDNRLSALASSIGFSVGSRTSVDDDQYLRLDDALIETDPLKEVEVDGEIGARTPIHVGVARDALRVVVPPSFFEESPGE